LRSWLEVQRLGAADLLSNNSVNIDKAGRDYYEGNTGRHHRGLAGVDQPNLPFLIGEIERGLLAGQ
jgi:hypothetical protein